MKKAFLWNFSLLLICWVFQLYSILAAEHVKGEGTPYNKKFQKASKMLAQCQGCHVQTKEDQDAFEDNFQKGPYSWISTGIKNKKMREALFTEDIIRLDKSNSLQDPSESCLFCHEKYEDMNGWSE